MQWFRTHLPFLALVAILIFAWLTRVYQLGLPAEYVFDEQYHVPAIRLIAHNDPRAFEWWHESTQGESNHDWLHPPLAKYIQAGFLIAFGDTPFSWRIGSAVFGVVGIGLLFIVVQLAFKKPFVSVLAAFLLSLDGLWLVQSRVAMNDIFVSVWFLAALAGYLWYREKKQPGWLLVVGFFGGLGLATKWTAAWWLGGLVIWEVLASYREKTLAQIPWKLFSLMALPAAIYFLTYLPLFWQGKTIRYFFELHKQILLYEMQRGMTHAYQSQPWQWFLNMRPVWYWHGNAQQNIFALGNPLLAGLEVIAVLWTVAKVFGRNSARQLYAHATVFAMYCISFVPWLVSPRIAFYYHYTPAAPLAAALLAYWLQTVYGGKQQAFLKVLFFLTLACVIWVFWLYYPRWTGLVVSPEWNRVIFELLPSWR